jgi:hypothetical protein
VQIGKTIKIAKHVFARGFPSFTELSFRKADALRSSFARSRGVSYRIKAEKVSRIK